MYVCERVHASVCLIDKHKVVLVYWVVIV